MVVDGYKTKYDYVYMHLQERSPFHAGRPGEDRPDDRPRRRDGQRPGLPPPLRDVERAWLVRRRQPVRPVPLPEDLGRLVVARWPRSVLGRLRFFSARARGRARDRESSTDPPTAIMKLPKSNSSLSAMSITSVARSRRRSSRPRRAGSSR